MCVDGGSRDALQYHDRLLEGFSVSGNEKSEFSAHITIMTSTYFTRPNSDDDSTLRMP